MRWRVLFFIFIIPLCLSGQDPTRFEKEIADLTADDKNVDRTDLILFVGSSSFRLWTDLSEDFSGKNVVNRGFGGSEMSDLIFYFDKLVTPYRPKKIFVYEGDNDLNSGKSRKQILNDFEKFLNLVRTRVSADIPIYLVSPKPSIARRKLLSEYRLLNSDLRKMASGSKHVFFVDVWSPAFDKNGILRRDIFKSDSLHLNEKGYAIWRKKLKRYVR